MGLELELYWWSYVVAVIASIVLGFCIGIAVSDMRKAHNHMSVTDFARAVTQHEGGKREVNIAQTREVLRVANDLLGGELYRIIKM